MTIEAGQTYLLNCRSFDKPYDFDKLVTVTNLGHHKKWDCDIWDCRMISGKMKRFAAMELETMWTLENANG